ncbi:elongation factor 1-beta [Striga asiatica]|uniref:Elongation factor 1-beta n=1 Tax=Striga asiatica TaxID=4170 RepID=A0A5A7PUX3_STRAF|nr:elongation factor 1-beta [Striga asiatica]
MPPREEERTQLHRLGESSIPASLEELPYGIAAATSALLCTALPPPLSSALTDKVRRFHGAMEDVVAAGEEEVRREVKSVSNPSEAKRILIYTNNYAKSLISPLMEIQPRQRDP